MSKIIGITRVSLGNGFLIHDYNRCWCYFFFFILFIWFDFLQCSNTVAQWPAMLQILEVVLKSVNPATVCILEQDTEPLLAPGVSQNG